MQIQWTGIAEETAAVNIIKKGFDLMKTLRKFMLNKTSQQIDEELLNQHQFDWYSLECTKNMIYEKLKKKSYLIKTTQRQFDWYSLECTKTRVAKINENWDICFLQLNP